MNERAPNLYSTIMSRHVTRDMLYVSSDDWKGSPSLAGIRSTVESIEHAIYTKAHVPCQRVADEKIALFTEHFKADPEARSTIVRSAADGDLVFLHVHSTSNPQDRGSAIVDIFRVDHGKIAEHWDVIQPVPEHAANDNTMF